MVNTIQHVAQAPRQERAKTLLEKTGCLMLLNWMLLTSNCYGYLEKLGDVLNSDHDCKNLIRFDCTLTLIHATREPDCKPLLMANNDTVYWVLHMSPVTA